MDILLVLTLLIAAWLGGHALDYVFNQVEKAIKPTEPEDLMMGKPNQEIVCSKGSNLSKAVSNSGSKIPVRQAVRLYLVPSATAKH